jgi:hypothetical protein
MYGLRIDKEICVPVAYPGCPIKEFFREPVQTR